MAKNKLKKFADLATYPHVIQPELEEVINKDHALKGKWNESFFKNNNPIVLELGCGKGEYTVGLARRYPNKNFLGVDIKGARIWKGASDSFQDKMQNVGFLRTRIEHIASYFEQSEVSEIWITFPDPQEKRLRAKKRLTSSKFLTYYKKFLQLGGIVHLKTDNAKLYNYTCKVCSVNELEVKYSTNDLYHSDLNEEVLLSIKTHYETQFLAQGISIKYLRFTIDSCDTFKEPPDDDKEG